MMPALLLALSCAIDLAVLLWLLRHREFALSVPRLSLSLAAAELVATLKMPFFEWATGSFFFGVTLGWATLVVSHLPDHGLS